MENFKLNDTTRQMIKDLHDDIDNLLHQNSNIEVVWKLENLHHCNAFLKSAELIKKSLKQ